MDGSLAKKPSSFDILQLELREFRVYLLKLWAILGFFQFLDVVKV